jgi:hypothetical protein
MRIFLYQIVSQILMFLKHQILEQPSDIPLDPMAATPAIPQPPLCFPLQVRDAVAVIRYLVWLEKNVPTGTVDEFSGAQILDKFRG